MQSGQVLSMRSTLAFFAVVGSLMTLTISSVVGVGYSGWHPTEGQTLTLAAAAMGLGGALVLFRHMLATLTLNRF